MKFTAKQIAGILDGTVEGNPETEVHQLSKIEEGELGSISFLANKKYNPFIYKTGASIVIVNNDLILDKEVAPTLIRVKDAYQAFSTLLEFYNQIDDKQEGIMEPVSIDKSVRINSSCYVGEFTVIKQNVSLGDHVKIDSQCYIGKDVTIGSGTKIHSGTRILSGTIIGENCVIHSEADTLDMEIITETIRAIALGTHTIINGVDTPSRVVLKEGEGRRK